jgi:mannose-6-phosphate isomerase-like protein (cupin superfamily)
MTATSIERAVEDMPSRPTKPVNLTATTETMSWDLACKVVSVSGPSEAIALEVRCMSYVENGHSNDNLSETVYVVISGFGILRCADSEVPCTTGDVLFVPKGCPHQFERLDGDIKIWRISLIETV